MQDLDCVHISVYPKGRGTKGVHCLRARGGGTVAKAGFSVPYIRVGGTVHESWWGLGTCGGTIELGTAESSVPHIRVQCVRPYPTT